MTEKIKEKLNLLINNFIKESSMPGVAVGIIEKGELIYSKGFGIMNINNQEPVTETTIFHMASISKPFVATGIMQLVEQGKLSLNDTVVQHLPYFKIKGEGYETITIKEILSHISGMPDVTDYEWDKPQYDDEALERHVRNTASCELLKEQRGKVNYSNLAFEVLGDLISKVSGMTFENYMKENILTPIGMKESSFLNKDINKSLLASPHCLSLKDKFEIKVSEIFPYNRRHAPSSTLCSNIVEMFNWALVNLNRGMINGVRILKEESYLELFTPHAESGWGSYYNHVGLSWFMGDYKGTKIITHSGCDTGFESNLLLLPDKEIGLVLMTNCDFIGLDTLTEALLDIILGYEIDSIKLLLPLVLTKTLINESFENAVNQYDYIKENCNDAYINPINYYTAYARKLCNLNKVNKAIDLLKLAILTNPHDCNLYNQLADLYIKNNNKEMAIKNLKIVLELNGENQKAIDMLNSLNSKAE